MISEFHSGEGGVGGLVGQKDLENKLNDYDVQVGPIKLSGYFTSESDRPLVHFIHGTGFCGLTYWPFLSSLSDRFDLFLHDVQGHGGSEAHRRFTGWNASASNALRVISSREVYFSKRPVLGVAHSFGAVVTLLMAAQDPERFSGLILLEPALFSQRQLRIMSLMSRVGLLGQNRLARRARRRTDMWSGKQAAWDYFFQRGIFKGWSDASLEAYIRYGLDQHADGSLTLKCPAWLEAQLFSSYPAGLWRQIKQLRVPTIIVRGHQGYPVLQQTATRAATLNPHIQVEVVKGGHCFMQEAPVETAVYLTGLLKRLLSQQKWSDAKG